MHKSFPFQCIFSASLPTFQKGVHCTKALHPLMRAVRAVQCAVRFSTLMDRPSLQPHNGAIFVNNSKCQACPLTLLCTL